MQKKKEKKFRQTFLSRNIYLKTYLFGICFSFIFLPIFAYAATTYTQDLFGIFEYLKDIIDDLVLWLFTTGAVLVFLGVLSYRLFRLSQGEKDNKDTNSFIWKGLLVLTLMFTFYGVVSLIAVTFGIQIAIPQFFGGQTLLTPGSGNVQKSYSVIGR
jgi:membrane protease YdiL (CAAX protease family)